MDQEKVKQTVRRMTEARASLMKENPFFGYLAMGLGFACAPCETACTDGSRLIFDPEFAKRLSDREMKFVVLHELLHVVLEHCFRGKNLLQQTYNIACDEVVNSLILDMWGMHSFRVAGNEVMHLAPDGQEGRLYNAEEIYEMLLRRQGKKCAAVGEEEAGLKKCSAVGAEEAGLKKCSAVGAEETGFDRHDLWQGICNRERLRDEWNDKIRNAEKNCGDVPGNIQRIVDDLTKRSNLDWKQLLHDFLQFDEYDYSYLPPDRRFPDEDFFLPAYNINPDIASVRDIWVCVDTSASIRAEELSEALAEILDAMRQARLSGRISFFDADITEPIPFETEDAFREITPTGGGGTSFRIIFDYLKEELQTDLPKAILIFTDGYARYPEEDCALGIPVLWIISKDGKEDVPWGRVARM